MIYNVVSYNENKHFKGKVKKMQTVANQVADETIERVKEGKPIIKVKKSELIATVYGLDRSKIITVHLRTFPNLNKKSRIDKTPAKWATGEVVKIQRLNCLIGINYQNCVNNQLEREGKEADFEALPPNWGINVGDSKSLQSWINSNKEFNLYVQLNPRKQIACEFKTLNGETITDMDYLNSLLPPKQEGSGRQGTDVKVAWIKPKVESFLGIATDGVYYQIVD